MLWMNVDSYTYSKETLKKYIVLKVINYYTIVLLDKQAKVNLKIMDI